MSPDEFGNVSSGSRPNRATTFDPNIGHPYTDDMSVAIERLLFGNLATRTAFVYKRSENNFTNIELARLGSFYTDYRTATDPGPDGLTGTADDGTFAYWDIPAGFVLPPSQTLRTTRKDNNSSAKNIDFTLTKRMSKRWSLVSNFLYTWNYNHSVVQTPNGELNNPQRTTIWTAKFFGTYQAPWSIVVTPMLRHQAGDPLSRGVIVTTRVGSTTFPVEPSGSYREDNVTIFDTRVERRFKIGQRRQFDLLLDAFNVQPERRRARTAWSGAAVTLENGEVVNYQRFLRPTTIIGPRVFRLGLRLSF